MLNGGFDDDVAAQRVSRITVYSYRNRMDSRRASIQDSKRLPFHYYFVQHCCDEWDDAFVAVAAADVDVDADVGSVCVHWSQLLSGCHCENRWNDSLTVGLDFVDNLDCAPSARESDNDVTYHLNSYLQAHDGQSVVTGCLDC